MLLFVLGSLSVYGHHNQVDADFARKIRPENKVDLSARKIVKENVRKRESESDVRQELAYAKEQKNKVTAKVVELESANTIAATPDLVKMKETQLYWERRIEMANKKLEKLAKKR